MMRSMPLYQIEHGEHDGMTRIQNKRYFTTNRSISNPKSFNFRSSIICGKAFCGKASTTKRSPPTLRNSVCKDSRVFKKSANRLCEKSGRDKKTESKQKRPKTRPLFFFQLNSNNLWRQYFL